MTAAHDNHDHSHPRHPRKPYPHPRQLRRPSDVRRDARRDKPTPLAIRRPPVAPVVADCAGGLSYATGCLVVLAVGFVGLLLSVALGVFVGGGL